MLLCSFLLVHQQVQRGLRQGDGSKNERNLILGCECTICTNAALFKYHGLQFTMNQHVARTTKEVYRTISITHCFCVEVFAWNMQTKFL